MSDEADWVLVPVFGERPAIECSVVRPSAYALIAGAHGRLAVVRTPEGVFLPGGGIEAGETPEQATVREALEECGLNVRIGAWSIRAVQHRHSQAEWTHYEKRSTFVDAEVQDATGTCSEPDHALEWVEPLSAASTLTDASHRWAVQEWIDRLRGRTA